MPEVVMKFAHTLFLVLTLALIPGMVVIAAEPSVTILSPVEGATLDLMEQNQVEYTVVPGPDGHHVHFYVDGSETAILRQLAGSHTLGSLAEGKHELCIKVVNRNHTPIGLENCINVTVE